MMDWKRVRYPFYIVVRLTVNDLAPDLTSPPPATEDELRECK